MMMQQAVFDLGKLICYNCGWEMGCKKFRFHPITRERSTICKSCERKLGLKIKFVRIPKPPHSTSRTEKKVLAYYSNYQKQRLYIKKRLKTDANFRLANNLRTSVVAYFTGRNKSGIAEVLLGCKLGQFKKHLKKKFSKGMTFDNYGEWEIDHIIPCCKFDLTNPEEQKKCFHYSNTQPLWRTHNRKKGGR